MKRKQFLRRVERTLVKNGGPTTKELVRALRRMG